jgi:hypothetical protein
MGDPIARLLELDTRHGELLDRLAELDQQISMVLTDWTNSKELFLEDFLKSDKNLQTNLEPKLAVA